MNRISLWKGLQSACHAFLKRYAILCLLWQPKTVSISLRAVDSACALPMCLIFFNVIVMVIFSLPPSLLLIALLLSQEPFKWQPHFHLWSLHALSWRCLLKQEADLGTVCRQELNMCNPDIWLTEGVSLLSLKSPMAELVLPQLLWMSWPV